MAELVLIYITPSQWRSLAIRYTSTAIAKLQGRSHAERKISKGWRCKVEALRVWR